MDNTFFSSSYNRVLATLVLVMVVAALGAYAYYTMKQSQYIYTGPTTISISGKGEVFAKPDVGQFSFTVTAKGAEATEAQGASAKANNEILAYLKEQGVEDRDVKVENYSLYPHYRYDQAASSCPGGYCPPMGEPIQDGFEVSQTVAVKVRDLNKAGELISNVGTKGATNISGLNFTVDDTDVFKAQARVLAIADAKEKSEQLAQALGVRIVRMTGYYEDENQYPMAYDMGGDMMKSATGEAAAVPSMPAGENMVTANVSVTYQVE